MRKPIMGIDLGTTNSCVAIPSNDGGAPGIVVVTDSYDRATIPSVVHKTEKGDYLVGHLAKQKMGTKPPPVAFIKRYMGKDHKVELRDELLTPEEVSAKILSYLKTLVKERLGDDINQAVLTIPARFELPGQQATVEAARMAGLEVLTTMPEPVAAALAYGLQDAADNLRVFCYDLGGGTFDATVMIKNPESGIEVLAFDGDPQLGGYNFDTILSKWILKELNRKYSLNLDWNDPDDLVIFQKLMRIAEKAKIELSKEPEYLISEKEIFEDHEGVLVDIELTVNQNQYEEMILPLIEETLLISERAIAKAKLTAAQIDRVILVGGSSRLPIVSRLLRKRLSCMPELVDPDKIVARGAAIKAGSMVGHRVEGLVFLTEIPRTCALDSIDIHGQVTLNERAGLTVYLTRADGGYEEETVTDDEGKFSFTNAELLEGEENSFEIRVGSLESPLLPPHRIEVQQSSEASSEAAAVPHDTNFVTQDISLLLSTGLKHIFKEGCVIPAEVHETLGTVYADQTFAKFDVCHGNHTLGEVRIDNLPPGLPKGSEVIVMVAINDDLTIFGQAAMVKTNQTVDFSFKIPKPILPGPEELQRKFAKLKADFPEAIETINDNTLKMKNWGEGQRHIRGIETALGSDPLDLPKISRLIDEMSMFINRLSMIDVMEPSWRVFQDNLDEARDGARTAEETFEKARRSGFTAALESVERFGTQAYQEKNKEAWQHANQQIDRIKSQIDDVLEEEYIKETREVIGKLSPEQRTALFREHLQRRLVELDARIDSNLQRFQRHKPKIQELISLLNLMNPTQPDQAQEIGRKISTGIEELEELLKFVDGPLETI